LRLMHTHGFNREAEVPLGWLLMNADRLAGIALTPASLRTNAAGQREVLVNFASWYLQPEVRWCAGLMLRTLLADTRCTYIDVTPNEAVSKMLLLTGFRAVSLGTVLAATPGHALRPARGVQVREWTAGEALPPGSPPQEQLEAHRSLACIPLLIDQGGHQTLLVYRAKRMRGFPVARLKFIGSHRALHQGFGAVARYFLRRGFAFVSFDHRAETPASRFNVLRSGGVWYARGGDFADRTDFIGTELSLLEF
jgi:hypothetical protein